MSQIERGNGVGFQPLRRRHHHGIDQAEPERTMARADPPGHREILFTAPLD